MMMQINLSGRPHNGDSNIEDHRLDDGVKSKELVGVLLFLVSRWCIVKKGTKKQMTSSDKVAIKGLVYCLHTGLSPSRPIRVL